MKARPIPSTGGLWRCINIRLTKKDTTIMTATLQTGEEPVEPGGQVDRERRAAVITASVVGGIGCAGVAVPMIASWGPSEREKAAGGPVEVDVSPIAPGQMKIVEWQGKPVWILHRTPA